MGTEPEKPMRSAKQTLDHEFLDARCQLVEVAAMLDRYDRAREEEGVEEDPRLDLLYEALTLLAARNAAPNRAERLLMLFTDPQDQ